MTLSFTFPYSFGKSLGPMEWKTKRQKSGLSKRETKQEILSFFFRRNTTDIMLHLIQPRFKNIFGEHYYR